MMRKFALSLALMACLSGLAFAQQTANTVTAEQKDIGKLRTRIQKYEEALGVIVQLVRPDLADVECNGVCYFPSSSRPVAWRCGPGKTCDLHCAVNPPVGGCD